MICAALVDIVLLGINWKSTAMQCLLRLSKPHLPCGQGKHLAGVLLVRNSPESQSWWPCIISQTSALCMVPEIWAMWDSHVNIVMAIGVRMQTTTHCKATSLWLFHLGVRSSPICFTVVAKICQESKANRRAPMAIPKMLTTICLVLEFQQSVSVL